MIPCLIFLFVCCGKGLFPSFVAGPGGDSGAGGDNGGDGGDTSDAPDDPAGGGTIVTVTSISPTTGGRGSTVTIAGTHFADGDTVTIGGVTCKNVSVTSPTSLTCAVGAHRAGTVSIVVTPPTGTPGSLAASFTYRSFLYVANTGDNTLNTLEINANGVPSTLGGANVTGTGPGQIILDPLGKFLFVQNLTVASLSSFHLDPLTGSLSETGAGSVALSGLGRQMAIHPSGTRIYESYSNTPPALNSIVFNRDALTFAYDGTVTMTNHPGNITLSPQGDSLYVGNLSGTGTANGFSVASDGSLAEYVDSPYDPDISAAGEIVFDATGKFAFITVPGVSYNVMMFRRETSSGKLTYLSQLVGSHMGGVKIATHPTLPFLYIFYPGTATAEAYTYDNTGNLGLSGAEFSTTRGCFGVAFDPQGDFAYTTNQSDDTISYYTVDSATGHLSYQASVSVGGAPNPIVVD